MIAERDAVKQIEDWLTLRCQSVNHRQLLLLCGDIDWQQSIAEAAIEHFVKLYKGKSPCPWHGERLSGKPVLNAHPNQLIGQQTALVTIDASERLAAKQLLVLAGTIEHQGLLIVLCPPLNRWRQSWSFLAKQSFGVDVSESVFATYLRKTLKEDKNTAIIDQYSDQIRLPVAPIPKLIESENVTSPFATLEQSVVGQNILDLLHKNTHQLISLTAKRGRGKTWMLGWLCSQWLSQGQKIAVISSRAAAIQPLFRQTDKSLSVQNLAFFAPDAADFDDSHYQLLIVDEAASIPIPMLLKLCRAGCHCVLSTTVDGYEGTGQGYLHRLLPEVQSRYQGLTEVSLKHPLRWHPNDCLENLLGKLFFLTTEHPTPQITGHQSHITYSAISKDQLLNEPEVLEQVYTLLKFAHYQTTADDLIRLMDCPDQTLYVARYDVRVVGVLLVIEEGNASVSSLSHQISSGQRRVAGHMSLQLCAFEAREPTFCTLSLWRITRIAVAKHMRRQGIASGLIQFAQEQAKQGHPIDAITTLFGSQAQLEEFWQSAGFLYHFRGNKINKASNAENVLYVLPLSDNGRRCFADAKQLTAEKHKAKILDFIAGHRTLLHCRDSFAWLRANMQQARASQILLRLEQSPKKLRLHDFDEFGITDEAELKNLLHKLVNEY